MSSVDLREKFRKLYAESEGRRAEMVHLFGIVHAEELKSFSLPQFCAGAQVPVSMATELRKGIKLSEYVVVKEGVL